MLDLVTRRRAWLSWRFAAHLAADRIRAVRHGSSWLEALSLPTLRISHGSAECAAWHCDPVARATCEDRMICTRRMNRLERIDMCTVVPYEYMSVGDVLNGLIYLILSSPTRVDAVWRVLRPFKEGEKFLQDPLQMGTFSHCGG